MNIDIFSGLFSNIWSIFLVIIGFGGSIYVHELGHYLAAKRRGLKIERFSIGLGPKLYSWRNKEGVEFCISLLPLGGYVLLPQLADMSKIEGKPKAPSASLPKISYMDKLIVLVMGAFFNILFAFVLATLLWGIGRPSSKQENTQTVGYVSKSIKTDFETEVMGPAYKAGILPGDKILAVDGISTDSFKEIHQALVTGSGRTKEGKPQVTLTVQREGKIFDLSAEPELVLINTASRERIRHIGILPEQSLVIGQVLENSPAQKAGLKLSDKLISANNTPLYSLLTLQDILAQTQNKPVKIDVLRGEEELTFFLEPQKIPFTKPTVQINLNQVTLKLLPLYPNPNKANPVDIKEKSSLMVYEQKLTNGAIPSVKPGYTLASVNGIPATSIHALAQLTDTAEDASLLLTFSNEDGIPQPSPLSVKGKIQIEPPKMQSLIGVQIEPTPYILHVNPFKQFYDSIYMTFRGLASLLSPTSDISLSQMMGPPGIIRSLHSFSSQDLRLYIWFLILLNINLAIFNLLPIPVLDGGHIAFETLNKLARNSISPKIFAFVQTLFLALLLALVIYISFFDVRRWQGDSELEEIVKRQQALYIQTKFQK